MQYVAGLLYDDTYSKVVLVEKKKFPPGCDWSANPYNAVGGHVEDGETPREAMRREFKEETGVDVPEWDYFCQLTNPGVWVVDFFCASNTEAVLNARTMEAEPIVVQPAKNLHRVVSNIRWLSELACDPSRMRGMATVVYST